MSRTIKEQHRYTQERQVIVPDDRTADEILRDITTTIAHDPGVGQNTSNPNVLAIPVDETPVSPPIVIYYTWDDESITLESMKKV